MEPAKRRNRHLTARQLVRRKASIGSVGSVPASTNLTDDNKGSALYHFGKKSAVFKDKDGYLIKVHDSDMLDLDFNQLHNLIAFAKSPMVKFMQDDGTQGIQLSLPKPGMLHFGIWMNNVKHYSGGRVHIMLAAYLLAELGHKVTIITDEMPRFLDDLKFFDVENRVEFIHGPLTLKNNWLLKNTFNNIDIVIATPRIIEAFDYAGKWNLPCYAMLLETPNYVSAHRGGTDGTDYYWRDYKKGILNRADCVLCNPGPTLEAAKEWLKKDDYQGKFYQFPPAINTPACDRVSCDEENEVVFVGRHLDFKCPDDVIKAVGKISESIRPSINFIGSHNSRVRARMQGVADRFGVVVRFYAGINDLEKFYIIKRSKVMIIPSRFEGFGMPPAEALYCGKPVIAYDLEITKWIYGNRVSYVKPGDTSGIAKKLLKYLKDEGYRVKRGINGSIAAMNPSTNIPVPYKIKNMMKEIFYGPNYSKITAGVIVLNGVDTLKVTLDSIYTAVDKIIVVEGVVEDYARENPTLHKEGHSIDGTLDLIEQYPDYANKIEVVKIEDVYSNREFWKNKNEMQNEIAKRIDTELYLKVDADELWKESDIEFVRRRFMAKRDVTVMYMQRWHFWKNLKTVAIGGQWDSAEPRAWRWNKDFRHPMNDKKGFNYFVDKDGKKVNEDNYKCDRLMMRMHYHLGYCRDDEHIIGKIRYYAGRGIERNVKDRYTDWKPGQVTNSTHPDGTTAVEFVGRLPIALDNSIPKVISVDPKPIEENNISMMPSPNKPVKEK